MMEVYPIIGYTNMDIIDGENNPIYIGNGILDQIKEPYYITGTITKKEIFEQWMRIFEDFYKQYPYAIKWDYEKFIRELLDYDR